LTESAEIAIVGGTGVYDAQLFDRKQEIKVHTPYGDTSDSITIGHFAGRKVAFIPRHGRGHRIPPHRINSRANIWALKQLGVKRILAPSAVGSLQEQFSPGDIVLPDQLLILQSRGAIHSTMGDKSAIFRWQIHSAPN